MDSAIAIAIAAALIAAASLYYTAKAANAAKEQTGIQRQLREDAAQPYLWADLRPSQQHGQLMTLVVGNAGPTVATDIRVTITPAPVASDPRRGANAMRDLERGLSALAPGRQITWTLGTPFGFFTEGEPAPVYEVCIDGNGPFGRVAQLTYQLDLESWRHSSVDVDGTLRGVSKEIEKATKKLVEAMSQNH